MVKCVFCGKDELSFRGIHLIKNDGSVDYFCSSKCRKNMNKLKRDKRKMKWTEAHGIALQRVRDKAVRAADKAQAEKEKEAEKEKLTSPKAKK